MLLNVYLAVPNSLFVGLMTDILAVNIFPNMENIEEKKGVTINLLEELSNEQVKNLKARLDGFYGTNYSRYDLIVLSSDQLLVERKTRGEPVFRLETVVRY